MTPRDDRRQLLPAVIFLVSLCVVAAVVLVDQVQAMAHGDRPSKVVLAAIVLAGAVLGCVTPLEQSQGSQPGSGPAVWLALVGSSGAVALVGLRRELPWGPAFLLAAVVGWTAVFTVRVVVRLLTPSRR